MGAKEAAAKIVPIAAAPASKAVLEWLTELELAPLTHWGWDPRALGTITYLLAAGGAALGTIWNVRTKCAKTWILVIGLLVLVGSYLGYASVASTPPPADRATLYDAIGIPCFFLTQLAFGFVVARVVKVFIG